MTTTIFITGDSSAALNLTLKMINCALINKEKYIRGRGGGRLRDPVRQCLVS